MLYALCMNDVIHQSAYRNPRWRPQGAAGDIRGDLEGFLWNCDKFYVVKIVQNPTNPLHFIMLLG
jgi:hypothetical protein